MWRSQVLLGRDDILKKVEEYIEGDNSNPTPLVLVGSPGAGKSAVVAFCAKDITSKSKYKTFYHFVGATPGSTDLYQSLTRLWTDLMPCKEEIPSELDEMVRSVQTMFVQASELAALEGYDRLVVLFDALNQMDDEGDAQSLRWLPSCLPGNMRVVVSTLDGKCRESLKQKKPPAREVFVNPLDVSIRKQIVTQILAEYSKALDLEQMRTLVLKEDAGRPLWLSVACEELRVFGSFDQLTQKITHLPGELIGLLDMVLARIISSYGGDLVKATLCLIEASRFGLLETELVELLAVDPVIPPVSGSKGERHRKTEDKIPMAMWALIFLGLKQYLRSSGNSGEGRLDFYHRTISKVVHNVYMGNEADTLKWHTRLADYFEHCADVERKAEELPHHCEAIGDLEGLKTCLLDMKVFKILYQESTKLQLMKYWQVIGGYEVAAEAYVNALASYKQENNMVDIDEIEPVQVRVAWFILDIGQYDLAQSLLEEVLEQLRQKYGEKCKLMSGCLVALVTLFYRQALKFVYGSNTGYKHCLLMGKKYAEQCIKIYKTYWPESDLELGRTLGLCGYFCSKVLTEAKTILEKAGDKRALSHVLYIIGEKQQYNPDMNIPIELFKQSLELCVSQFGRYHLQTARCYQLYGQLYWNTFACDQNIDWMGKCLPLYENELEIIEELLGSSHPTTVRSREDVIIILQTMDRHDEANVLARQQPAQHDAL
ncbi:nephrocystin-3-like [Liolophura sinensis]|uniref:nephrocystin-3-like n=1 Tax=Liolophura sinensis TaxID=3198878 RepID=UPI003158EBB5